MHDVVTTGPWAARSGRRLVVEVLAGCEGREGGRRRVLRHAVRAEDVEDVDQVDEVELAMDCDAARPVLQVGSGGGDREAAGPVEGQGLGIVNQGPSSGG